MRAYVNNLSLLDVVIQKHPAKSAVILTQAGQSIALDSQAIEGFKEALNLVSRPCPSKEKLSRTAEEHAQNSGNNTVFRQIFASVLSGMYANAHTDDKSPQEIFKIAGEITDAALLFLKDRK